MDSLFKAEKAMKGKPEADGLKRVCVIDAQVKKRVKLADAPTYYRHYLID